MKKSTKKNKENGEFNVGKFEVNSSKVLVSDPCYKLDSRCNGIVNNVRNGKWVARVTKKYGMIFELLAHCEKNSIPSNDERWIKQEFEVGVDSGQAGIFDFTSFKKDELVKGLKRLYKNRPICSEDPWYSFCCDRTLSKMGAGVIPGGAVSSSGYGDGIYSCATIKDKSKQVIGIMIDYN